MSQLLSEVSQSFFSLVDTNPAFETPDICSAGVDRIGCDVPSCDAPMLDRDYGRFFGAFFPSRRISLA